MNLLKFEFAEKSHFELSMSLLICLTGQNKSQSLMSA